MGTPSNKNDFIINMAGNNLNYQDLVAKYQDESTARNVIHNIEAYFDKIVSNYAKILSYMNPAFHRNQGSFSSICEDLSQELRAGDLFVNRVKLTNLPSQNYKSVCGIEWSEYGRDNTKLKNVSQMSRKPNFYDTLRPIGDFKLGKYCTLTLCEV